MNELTRAITMYIDLCFSPDEGVWYFQDHDEDNTSQDFETAEQAMKAWSNQGICWDNE